MLDRLNQAALAFIGATVTIAPILALIAAWNPWVGTPAIAAAITIALIAHPKETA